MLYLSLGENCLSDDILRRHGLKSFSTPYSHGRTNIDYALALEHDGYKKLLAPEALHVGDAWGKRVIRSTHYAQDAGIFESSCSQGFEFTHHDPLENIEHRQSYERKITRLIAVRGQEDVCFLYHHRTCGRSNLEVLRNKLSTFSDLYSTDKVRCLIVLYYQSMRVEPKLRRIEQLDGGPDFMEFCFHTEFAWGGANPDHLWARVDDDLIGGMLTQVVLRAEDREQYNAAK